MYSKKKKQGDDYSDSSGSSSSDNHLSILKGSDDGIDEATEDENSNN